jgi:hypothetical protein
MSCDARILLRGDRILLFARRSVKMKTAFYSLCLSALAMFAAHADLTIVYSTTVQPANHNQKGQPTPSAVTAASNMSIKIKGDKARIDVSPELTTIFDGGTGDLLNLLNDQKTIVRISPEKMKGIAEMLNRSGASKAASDKPRLTPTGQREMINGYDTEQYTYDCPDFKATYWIAPNYPNGAAVLAQLQSIKSEFWDAANTKMPDFRDFPGLPIRMRMIVSNLPIQNAGGGSDHPTEVTTVVSGVSLNSIPDNQFTVPADFKEIAVPDIFTKTLSPSTSPGR